MACCSNPLKEGANRALELRGGRSAWTLTVAGVNARAGLAGWPDLPPTSGNPFELLRETPQSPSSTPGCRFLPPRGSVVASGATELHPLDRSPACRFHCQMIQPGACRTVLLDAGHQACWSSTGETAVDMLVAYWRSQRLAAVPRPGLRQRRSQIHSLEATHAGPPAQGVQTPALERQPTQPLPPPATAVQADYEAAWRRAGGHIAAG